MDEIVSRILVRLEELKIDQKTFAKEIGVSPVTITDWKTGKSKSYMKKINIISAALASPLGWLVFGEGPSSKIEEARISGELERALQQIAHVNSDTAQPKGAEHLDLGSGETAAPLGKKEPAPMNGDGLSEAKRRLWEAVDDLTDEQCEKLLGIVLEAKRLL